MAVNPLAPSTAAPLAGTLNPPPGVWASGPPRLTTPGAPPATLNIPTSPALTAPMTPRFTGTAPRATPYGNFTAPNPADIANDPGYQFEQSEGTKALQRSAAAHGTLLSGALLKSLEKYSQGLASTRSGEAFDRALNAYTANRATNAQNYGQQTDEFGNDLNAFNANAGVGLNYGRLGLDTAQYNDANAWRTAGAQQDNQQAQNDYNASEQQRQSDNSYAQQVEDARRAALSVAQQNAATNAVLPAAPMRSPLSRRELR